MKLQMRKVLSLVLALTLVLGLAPVRTAAEGTSPRYISLADCPSFTLRGPEGVYPLEQYSNNAMVLVFGRVTCGNTQALLSQLNGMVDSLAEQGIQVFANMEYTFRPEDFSAIRSAYPNITYTYGDDMIRTRLLDLVDPHLESFIFPLVFVIDRNGSIIYYSTGYVSDMEPLLTKAEAAATNQPLPDPQPWDDRFYGSLYNYTGDDAALEDYIHQELLEKNPYISAYDSVWTGSMDIWQGEDLAYAMFDILEADAEAYGPYTIPDTWVYYSDARQVLIILDYPYVPTQPTEPVETEPEETKPQVTEPKETEPKETEPEVTEPGETKPATPPVEEDKPMENPFVDMAEDAYYFEPVLWAVNEGITNGMTETTFAPDGTCTRAQIVTFLWRANGSPKVGSTNPFTDVPADAWYTDAVLWAVEQGITTGTSATTFSPDAGCTRGQVATFLWRAEGEPASGAENIFTDITPDAYYYDAVLWAVANEITKGMGDGAFAPDATCTRGQIVTFLYRAMA